MELVRDFPLFPLGLVALPSELVPLHIFEERYKTMMARVLEEEGEFGIVWAADDGLRDVGCACEIVEVLERMPDGRLNLVARGTRPFRIESRQDDLAYPAGTVEFLDDRDEEPDPDAARDAHAAYSELIDEATDREPDPEEIGAMTAYEMAATVEFGLDAKQGLLDLRSEGARLKLVARLVRAALKRLEFAERAQARARSNGKVHFPELTVGVIGVPTSAGAFAPGQELAPAALRAAGLLEALGDATDHGDREPWRWRPDREHPHAQNLGPVVEIVEDTARRVREAGGPTLVLGGDCTVGIGTIAGHPGAGLVYLDLHADLNVPSSAKPGAFDWMGMAHMLGEPGAEPALVAAGPHLTPDRVVLLGWGEEEATPHEREAVARLGLRAIRVGEVHADPTAAARAALDALPGDVVVHFDVDIVDFTDTPLSENTGRNIGLPYATVIAALHALLASDRVVGLTVTELNPLHVEEGAGSLERLARDLGAFAR